MYKALNLIGFVNKFNNTLNKTNSLLVKIFDKVKHKKVCHKIILLCIHVTFIDLY